MSYLIISTEGGASHRRVDLSTIAELFVEDEPAAIAPPTTLVRARTVFRSLVAPLGETLALLRDEALARKLQTHHREHRVVRAFGI